MTAIILGALTTLATGVWLIRRRVAVLRRRDGRLADALADVRVRLYVRGAALALLVLALLLAGLGRGTCSPGASAGGASGVPARAALGQERR